MKKSAAIVGAGIAGIAAAIRLACKGYTVNVYEANAYAGGKLSEFNLGDYRFDAGPSLFTMPRYVEDLFALAGKNVADYFQYERLPITCEYFYPDGTHLSAYSDWDKFAAEISAKTTEKPETIARFLAKSRLKYEITADVFLHNSLHKWTNYLSLPTLKGMAQLHRLDIFQSLNDLNSRTFRDPRVVQMFNRYATYNGSNPYETPGIMSLIPHFEFGIGAFFPRGGMYAITRSLVRLAKDLGVEFFFNAPVDEIMVHHHKVSGIRIGKDIFMHEVVVSNMDIVGTYRRLLPKAKAPTKLLEQPKSSSAVIFYWGVRQSFPQLDLHNIFFTADYKTEFDHIFKRGSLYADPTIYINITSKYNPSDAPKGCENWFVMVNAPHNQGQDWDGLIAALRQNIIAKLSKILGVDIAPLIEAEDILDPRSIEARTSSDKGALYGNSSNNRYAAFLRHANFSTDIRGLYFCGGSVHPGGGIPLALMSGKIAADSVG